MKKRYRTPQAKDGELLVTYGQDHGERDLFYCWPDNDNGMKADSRLLMTAIERVEIADGKTLREILTARGYDIETFALSVRKAVVAH